MNTVRRGQLVVGGIKFIRMIKQQKPGKLNVIWRRESARKGLNTTSGAQFDLRAPSSTDVPTLLLKSAYYVCIRPGVLLWIYYWGKGATESMKLYV